MIDLKTLNQMSAREFVAALASIFEHSPWVAQRAAELRPFDSGMALHRALCEAVTQAGEAQQLALIRAHPELAGHAALRGDLTAVSTGEQRRAGLANCTPDQLQRLTSLNGVYSSRFGFPFVLAVRGHTPDTVIAAMERRVTHSLKQEQEEALREIFTIARFRLADLLQEPAAPATTP
jgi:2-oxo-4-hydroxy-4-carboxy-5-ureidoimidazoline decarboxylase